MKDLIKKDATKTIILYSIQHNAEFVSAKVTLDVESIYPGTGVCLWRELDVVGMTLKVQTEACGAFEDIGTIPVDVDEQADSAARKCVMYFGLNHNPALAIAFKNQVRPDAQRAIKLVEGLGEYETTLPRALEVPFLSVLMS